MSNSSDISIDSGFIEELYRIGGVDAWNTLFDRHSNIVNNNEVVQYILFEIDRSTGFETY